MDTSASQKSTQSVFDLLPQGLENAFQQELKKLLDEQNKLLESHDSFVDHTFLSSRTSIVVDDESTLKDLQGTVTVVPASTQLQHNNPTKVKHVLPLNSHNFTNVTEQPSPALSSICALPDASTLQGQPQIRGHSKNMNEIDITLDVSEMKPSNLQFNDPMNLSPIAVHRRDEISQTPGNVPNWHEKIDKYLTSRSLQATSTRIQHEASQSWEDPTVYTRTKDSNFRASQVSTPLTSEASVRQKQVHVLSQIAELKLQQNKQLLSDLSGYRGQLIDLLSKLLSLSVQRSTMSHESNMAIKNVKQLFQNLMTTFSNEEMQKRHNLAGHAVAPKTEIICGGPHDVCEKVRHSFQKYMHKHDALSKNEVATYLQALTSKDFRSANQVVELIHNPYESTVFDQKSKISVNYSKEDLQNCVFDKHTVRLFAKEVRLKLIDDNSQPLQRDKMSITPKVIERWGAGNSHSPFIQNQRRHVNIEHNSDIKSRSTSRKLTVKSTKRRLARRLEHAVEQMMSALRRAQRKLRSSAYTLNIGVDISKLFAERLDRNRDGAITIQEFQHSITRICHLHADWSDLVFAFLDNDADGLVTLQDISAFLSLPLIECDTEKQSYKSALARVRFVLKSFLPVF